MGGLAVLGADALREESLPGGRRKYIPVGSGAVPYCALGGVRPPFLEETVPLAHGPAVACAVQQLTSPSGCLRDPAYS